MGFESLINECIFAPPFHDINVMAFPQRGKKTPGGVLKWSFQAIHPTT